MDFQEAMRFWEATQFLRLFFILSLRCCPSGQLRGWLWGRPLADAPGSGMWRPQRLIV